MPREGVNDYVRETDGASDGVGVDHGGGGMDTGDGGGSARIAGEQSERDDRQHGGIAERLLKIGKECAPLWKEPFRSIEHGDLLYDENGLPK